MNKPGFIIEELTITGQNKPTATVEFCPGANLIVGSSQTGKSLIVDCIDYALGYEVRKGRPFRLDVLQHSGYDKINLRMRTIDGSLEIHRNIVENKVTVEGIDKADAYGKMGLRHSKYKNLNDTLLQLMGMNDPHKILKSVKGRVEQVSWRGLLHFLLVNQDNIVTREPILINPYAYTVSKTSSRAMLLYLLSGHNADHILTPAEKEIKKKVDTAVRDLYEKNYADVESKEKNLMATLISMQSMTSDDIASIEKEISVIQEEIDDAVNESKSIMDKIYSYNDQLSNLSVLQNRFSALNTQYNSDMERMEFIIEGAAAVAELPQVHTCPFCGSNIASEKSDAYVSSIRSDVEHIRSHMSDLETTRNDVTSHAERIRVEVESLEARKKMINERIENELKPRLKSLMARMNEYKQYIQVQTRLEDCREEMKRSKDVIDQTSKDYEEETPRRYDIRAEYQEEEATGYLENTIKRIFKDMNFPNWEGVQFDPYSFDVSFYSFSKAGTMGGGFCSLINAVMILALKETLINHGKYAPGFAILDSPLSMLSESDTILKVV